MQLAGENPRGYRQKRHRQQGKKSEQGINGDHKTDCRKGHNQGIDCGHHPHAAGHLHCSQIVARMGHEVAGGMFFKKRRIHL